MPRPASASHLRLRPPVRPFLFRRPVFPIFRSLRATKAEHRRRRMPNTSTRSVSSTPAPATLSSAIGWTVDATVLSQPGLSSFDIGGGASIGVSLSSCYCPEQFVSDNIVGSGTFTLSNPFTIPNGGTIAYRTDLAAFVYNSGGLTGSVSIDPQVSLTLPQGWTGYLGSGGVLGGPVLSATPEPSSLILLGTFLAVWGGRRLAQRERLSSGEVEAGR